MKNINPVEKLQKYQYLIAHLKSHEDDIDFYELRMLYTQTPIYNPYDDKIHDLHDGMYAALSKPDFQKALECAETIFEKCYVDMDAHFVCSIIYAKLNDPLKNKYHQFVYEGLFDSIVASGDGKSPETAFQVISTNEEYFLLQILGCQPKYQQLLEINNRKYDLMIATSAHTNEEIEIYFNVDIPHRWFGQRLKRRR